MSEPRKKMGRPAGSGEQGTWENINIKVPPSTKYVLENAAEREGVSLGAYIRPSLEVLASIPRKARKK